MLSIIVTIMVTNIVTCDYAVVHILQHNAEICCCGAEFRAQFFSVPGELFCFTDDLTQAAAAAFHEAHAVKEISDHGIAAHGSNRVDVAILDGLAFEHATRRLDFQTIIIHVNVDLTAAHDIISMDQGIDQGLSHGAACIVWLVHTILCLLLKAHLGIVADEIAAVL